MNFVTDLLRLNRGKSNLHALFVMAALGQALALAMGLWLEQKLIDSSAAWKITQHSNQNTESGTSGGLVPTTADEVITESSSLFNVKLIVFLWICIAQAVIAYLILARWNTARALQQAADANAFAKQNHDLVRTRDAVIFGLAKLAESRDPDTGHHLERIAIYSTRLADAMRRHPHFASEITPSFLKLLGISSALHDIGKVGVEDAILLKPGRLTDSERQKIQQHTLLGGDCIEQIESRLGASNFLEMAREIALYHHERWDGTGYPKGLVAEQIPLAARIIAVADVYDALSVKRVYKNAFSHEKCVRIIRDGAGTQFDPYVVEVFLQIEAQFRQCAEEMSDLIVTDEVRDPDPTAVMTPEQEQFLARLIVSEKYCTVDTLLEPAGRTEAIEATKYYTPRSQESDVS
ncbi:MAG: rpfG 4 [Planctomycetaceae bacterium]|nr:rpfG 4 [Planctomycetaceae bacterium]